MPAPAWTCRVSMETESRGYDQVLLMPTTSYPPGWYPDPWRPGATRLWDGAQWTGWTSPAVALHTPVDPPSPTFAPQGAVWVIVATVAAIFLARFIGTELDYRGAGLATAVFYLIIFSGMFGAAYGVSRRFGTGSLAADFGMRIRTIDIGWGLVALFASFVARVAFAIAVGVDDQVTRDLGDGLRDHTDVLVVFAIAALIGAPLFEELVFRGVIQRSITKVAGPWVGVIGQGVLFGFYHVVGAFDLTSVFYVGSLSVIGIVLGIVADRTGRLGAGMITHCLSNALALIAILAL